MRREVENQFQRLHSNIENLIGKRERPLGRVTDEELGNFVSAFGNSEGKSLLLLCLSREPNRVFTQRGMESALSSVQEIYPRWHSNYREDQDGWAVSSAGPQGWCRDSLEPIGLVANQVVDQYHSSYGYCITAKGLEKGVVFAGLLLDFSYRHKISLTDLFGYTFAPGAKVSTVILNDGQEIEVKKRNPITRLKIFWEIATAKLPLRAFDIGNATGATDDNTTGRILAELGRLGLVEYEYRDPESYSLYRYVPQPFIEPTPIKYDLKDSITRDVFSVLKQEPDRWFDAEDICTILRERFPKRKRQANLKTAVWHSLGQKLIPRKLIELSDFNSYDHVLSSASLDEYQRRFLIELLTLLDNYANCDPETWQKGRQLANQILQDSRKARLLMEKAKKSSPNADKPSAAQKRDILADKVRAFPGHTSSEIRDLVEKDGLRIALGTVKRHLKEAKRENLVSGIVTPHGIRWSEVDNE